MSITFDTPTDDQYQMIWKWLEDNEVKEVKDIEQATDYLRYWIADIPNVGLVMGGSDKAGSWDEQIVHAPPGTKLDEIIAAVDETRE